MDQINFWDLVPAEIWTMVIRFLLQDSRRGSPPSVWRVRHLLWPVAMADFDSLLCVTCRAFLATIYETTVKKSPTLTKLLTPLGIVGEDEKARNGAIMARMKEALKLFLRNNNKHEDHKASVTELKGLQLYHLEFAVGGPVTKGFIEFIETKPKNWRQGFLQYSCVQTGESTVSRISTMLWIRRDPFHHPYLWAQSNINDWWKGRYPYPSRKCLLEVMEGFSVMVAQVANELHGNMELCLYLYQKTYPIPPGRPFDDHFEHHSITFSISISHPVTKDAALIIVKVLAKSILSDRGDFRVLGGGSCDLGARIYCTDEHETPTGYGWAVGQDEETPRWFLTDPYKNETCHSLRLLKSKELTTKEKAYIESVPIERQPTGVLTKIYDTKDDGEPPPTKRAKLQ